MDSIYIGSFYNLDNLPEKKIYEICLVGRSNVGKSSFINSYTNRKKLAHTSTTPGKTISLNYYLIDNKYYLVDSPGYGYAKRGFSYYTHFKKLLEGYFSLKRNNLVLLFIDGLIGPTDDDLMMIEYLEYNNLDYLIILTKIDKVKQKIKVKTDRKINTLLKNRPTIKISSAKKININLISEILLEKINKIK